MEKISLNGKTVAPSYQDCPILCEVFQDAEDAKKEWVVIDYKGKEKKVRVYAPKKPTKPITEVKRKWIKLFRDNPETYGFISDEDIDSQIIYQITGAPWQATKKYLEDRPELFIHHPVIGWIRKTNTYKPYDFPASLGEKELYYCEMESMIRKYVAFDNSKH
jgi:hypothetical protein